MTNTPGELYMRHCRPRVGEILQALRLDVVYHRAEGDFLYYQDERGREVAVADFLGGFGALVFGHNPPELTAIAVEHYTRKRPFLAQMSCRANTARLGAKLDQMMRERTGRSFITTLASTGTEAVEAAMKHAEYAHTERLHRLRRELDDGEAGIRRGLAERRYTLAPQLFESARARLRLTGMDDFERVAAAVRAHNEQVFQAPSVFLSLERAFHGKTLGSVALTHHADYRRHFLRSSPRALFVESGDVRGLEDTVRQAALPYLALAVGRDNQVTLVERSHPNISALFVEPLQGEGGIRIVPRPFLRRCRELATEHGFPLVFDEIQCGMGRTGTFLFSEQQEVTADYYILSKGLGGGVAKVSALLVERSQYEKDFGLIHTSTFAEDELGSAVALGALELLEGRPELMRNCSERGRQLLDGLMRLQGDFPDVIKDVRGAGLMLGVEFHPQEGRGSPAISAIFAQDLLSYVISGYLLHEHRVRIAPCMSNKALIRVEPSALVTAEACDALLEALRGVCEVIEAQNAFELLRFTVGRPRRGGQEGPVRSYRQETRGGKAPEVDARVAFIGYFVEAAHLRLWDASLSAFSDAELEDLVRRMYLTVDPFVVDEQVVRSVNGRRVGLTVVGIPIDSATFARDMRGEGRDTLAAKVQEAVKVAEDRGCSVAALGGFTSIVTGNGLNLRADRIALTTGNALTVAMGLQSITRAATQAGIDLSRACFAAIGATGNIGSVYSQVLAEQVPRLILIGRSGRTRELEAVAADIYLNAARDLAAREGASGGLPPVAGVAAAVAHTRAMCRALAEGLSPGSGRRLYEELTAELREHAPITVTTDLEMLRHANLILGASNAPTPVIQPALLGRGPLVICDVAIPSDVEDSVRTRPDVHIVEGGLVRMPLDPELTVHGLDLPRGHLYACCCEGVLMGLSGIRENYSIGAITRRQVVDVMKLASQHGFTLGERGASPMRAL
jgi:acetylornithine/succinyldiaminopimelate/putrescine aminotransferase/predicted amino acid dehydrogenase